jgi:hypothetical protein
MTTTGSERGGALTRRELDLLSCSTPGCRTSHGPLAMHSSCHTGEPVWAWYSSGVIEIHCGVCRRLVVRVAVEAGE